MKIFPDVIKYQMEKARKHGNLGLTGIPTEPGKYHCSRVCEAEIVLFLDFNQFGRLVVAVASGTLSLNSHQTRKLWCGKVSQDWILLVRELMYLTVWLVEWNLNYKKMLIWKKKLMKLSNT